MNLAQKVRRVMNAIGLSDMSMHNLRHAHATQLLRKGILVKAVSARRGLSSNAKCNVFKQTSI